jgi:ubiquinone/menaquinone biosynthesis C-methylase UbiE
MDYFGKSAQGWDEQPGRVATAEAVANAIRRHVVLRPYMTVFEYGCGTGLLSCALRPFVGALRLADNSTGMVAAAREKITANKFENMEVIRLDLQNEPPPDERFDLVCASMAMHHIRDTAAVIHAFHTLLKTPGTLCIADLDAEDGSFHGAGFDGHDGFERPALAAMASAAGFHNVRFVTAHEIIRANTEGSRRFPVFLMIAERVAL